MTNEPSFHAFVQRIDDAGQALAEAAEAEPEKLGEVFTAYKALAEAFFKTVRLMGKLPEEAIMKAMADVEAEEAAVAH